MKRIVVILYLILLIAVLADMQTNKIPNRLIVTGAVIGMITTEDIGGSILRAIIIILIFFPFFSIGALGAGDVKCMAMSGIYLTTNQLAESIVYIFIIAAIFSILKLIHNRLKPDKGAQSIHTIHMALPIFLGVLLSVGGNNL